MLHDLSLNIAKDSYLRCAAVPGFDQKFFARFYREFLHLCPEAKPYFNSFGTDKWVRQQYMLKEAILLLFAYRQQHEGDSEPNVLTRIATVHPDIPLYIYDRFVDALIHIVCGNAARHVSAFDPECLCNPQQRELIEAHWRKAIEPGVSYIKARASARPSLRASDRRCQSA
jgi:hypothetical protein